MSIEEKILALQEAAKKIEADKADDEAIDGEDETKPNGRKEITKEEFEGLDESEQALYELSKSTLGSYVKKAAEDNGYNVARYTQNSPSSETARKACAKYPIRRTGIGKATDRLTKESTLALCSMALI
jgi:hypothetical protein